MPYMDEDMRQLAAAAVNKLQAMTDSEFSEREFILTDEESVSYTHLDRKVFTDKAAMEKYLNGRIKAYDRLFTEISPPIPQEYACLLYTSEQRGYFSQTGTRLLCLLCSYFYP